MKKFLKKNLKSLMHKTGYQVVKGNGKDPIIDEDKEFLEMYEKCIEYTMTSKERMYALYKAVKYIVDNKIPGDFVECGVWKGGSTMLIAYTLRKLKDTSRKIYLYDTFEGMSEPTEVDVSNSMNEKALTSWNKKKDDSNYDWCTAFIDDVKRNMTKTRYPRLNIVYVKGKVEDTIPKELSKKISLLRLDTDWYESTKHELVHMYPKLSKQGVLIIDDYGCWAGAKLAVDEYFKKSEILLNRIDDTGVIGIKTQ